MSEIQSQLAIFGAIDEAVCQMNDPQVTRMVERFLPGTTGFRQRGWYRELQDLTNRLAEGRREAVAPNLPEAVDTIATACQARSGQPSTRRTRDLGNAPATSVAGGSVEPTEAKAFYGAVVLDKIKKMTEDKHRSADRGFVYVRAPRGLDLDPQAEPDPDEFDPLARLLPTVPVPGKFGVRDLGSSGDLLTALDRCTSRTEVTRTLETEAGPEFAETARSCFGQLQRIDGESCTLLSTTSEFAGPTIEDIKAYINPVNWPRCSKFFCDMTKTGTSRDGWSRITEKVSAECGEYGLVTNLKFWTAQVDDGLQINYTLDVDRSGDSGLVEVDNGYIWITPTTIDGVPGVRIRTSKQVRIRGVSPTATAVLACLTGWGDVGSYLVAGPRFTDHVPRTAAGEPEPPVAFESSPGPPPPMTVTGQQPPEETGPRGGRWRVPKGMRADLIGDSARVTSSLLARGVVLGRSVARSWQDGMSEEDVDHIADEVGAGIRQYVKYAYTTAQSNVRPAEE